jgi:hypothetical protein
LASFRKVRLIEFILNESVKYVIEINAFNFRFIKNGAYIYNANKTITSMTLANPVVIGCTAHGYTEGDMVQIDGIPELEGREFLVGPAPAANTFTLQTIDQVNVNGSGFAAFVSGSVRDVYTVGHSWSLYFGDPVQQESRIFESTYAQSGNVVYFACGAFFATLTRTNDTSWAWADAPVAPVIAAPAGLAVSGASGFVDYWVVTAISKATGEESMPDLLGAARSDTVASSGSPRTLTWTAVSGASEYNVYKSKNGIYSYIGTTNQAASPSFIDNGLVPDQNVNPPISFTYNGTQSWSLGYAPYAVGLYQQRLIAAAMDDFPETAWTSRLGLFNNFTTDRIIQDDNAIKFTIVGRIVDRIRHILDLGQLVFFTGQSEISANPEGQALTPTSVNPKAQSYNGCSARRPLVIDNSAVYVQAEGSVVRDLAYEFNSNGYRGNELSLFSAHLVDGYQINDWAYQKTPNSIIWMVRDDGKMLGLTYVKEQGVIAWHRHDMHGATVESVASLPNNDGYDVYVAVKRTIGGIDRRYVEKFTIRNATEETRLDMTFMDSHLTYDGRNTTATTMTLSGGTDWDDEELLTLTASASFFVSGDVGNEIQLFDADGEVIRFEITGYTSATVVTGFSNRTVPASLQATAVTTWTKAVDVVSGLWHLEGQDVAIMGDGAVVASPFNEAYEIITVTDGEVTLPRPYGVIHVGLPYISDIETLDIDSASGEALVGEYKNIGKVKTQLRNTLGMWVGAKPPTDDDTDPLEGLYEAKFREFEDMDDLTQLYSGQHEIVIKPEWNSNGRVFIRQVDPVPISIQSIHADGDIPFGRGGGQ